MGAPAHRGKDVGLFAELHLQRPVHEEGRQDAELATPTEIGIEGGSLTSDGTPSRGSQESQQPFRLVHAGDRRRDAKTISWSLREMRRAAARDRPRVRAHEVPDVGQLAVEISEQTGTVDGNWVRIKATVFNASAEAQERRGRCSRRHLQGRQMGRRASRRAAQEGPQLHHRHARARRSERRGIPVGFVWLCAGTTTAARVSSSASRRRSGRRTSSSTITPRT